MYLKDYKEELIVIALKKGYSYDNIHGKFVPPLPANMTALEQKVNIVGHKNLWIPPVFFYMFSILWIISYYNLMFTNTISSNTYETVQDTCGDEVD